MLRIETTSLPVAPIDLPVTLDDAKLHARIELDDEDSLVLTYIEAATTICEQETQKRFIDRSFTIWYDLCDIDTNALLIEKFDSGLTQVLFERYDDDGTATAITSDEAQLLGNRLILSSSFPASGVRQYDSYRFDYTVSAANLTMGVVEAIYKLVTEFYENRETQLAGSSLADYHTSVKDLLANDKLYSV